MCSGFVAKCLGVPREPFWLEDNALWLNSPLELEFSETMLEFGT